MTVTNAELNTFARSALGGSLPPMPSHWEGAWAENYDKFQQFWDIGAPVYSIFVKGNAKLPFWAFSSLPDFTCPGAGDCLKWCYSFKAWRYPAAFFRQLQNAVLMQSDKPAIARAFLALPKFATVRLYVDGDIDSIETMRFWWRLLALRLDLPVYGYSKSWMVFLQYDKTGEPWPINYKLNLSSGSKYPAMIRDRVAALPVTRGEFVAFPVSTKMPDRRTKPATWAQWAALLKATARAAGYAKSFVCPGKCGDCLPNGQHACGSERFQGVAVVIGQH